MIRKLREKTFYIAVVVSLWLCIGNWIEYKLPLDSYRIVNATVKEVEASRYDCSLKWNRRRMCEQTLVRLHGYSATFEVADREGRGAYIPAIQPGEKVYLLTRHWYQYLLTFGNYYSIYHLESEDGQVYYSDGYLKAANWGYSFFSGILFLVFLLFLMVDPQIQKDKKRSAVQVTVPVYEDKVTWE